MEKMDGVDELSWDGYTGLADTALYTSPSLAMAVQILIESLMGNCVF
jgi:hypothetical protein